MRRIRIGLFDRHTLISRTAGAFAALIAFVLTACTDTGPVFPTSSILDGWVAASDALDPRSDRAPVITDDVVKFRLARGERRSMLRPTEQWEVEETFLFGFDVRLDRKALGRSLGGRSLLLSRFVRQGKPETDLVEVKVDARQGVTVMGRRCIAPSELGNWHSVEIRINLTDGDTGYLEVFCDRKPIWAQAGFRTTLPPICRLSEGCNKGVPKPVQFEWQVGLLSKSPVGHEVKVEMQRVFYHRLFVIPNRVVGAL